MPPRAKWNLDFFTRTTSGRSAKLLTRNLCHAYTRWNLAQSCTISMRFLWMCVGVSYSIRLTEFSCKQLCWFVGKKKILSSRWWRFITATSAIGFKQDLRRSVLIGYSSAYVSKIACHVLWIRQLKWICLRFHPNRFQGAVCPLVPQLAQ